ncbi:MAG TPA: low affinity iron permease family protein [Actinomycetota bacterium]|nr:low affinity iron permease family protein [Actinomycetota bacterium]
MAVRKIGSLYPSGVTDRIGFFDRFAGRASQIVSRAPFFAFCVLLVIGWLIEGVVHMVASGPSEFLNDSYQLQINTTTTIITFLLVALLQNSQTRSDRALHHKLNALADGLADLMGHLAERADDEDLRQDIRELRAAVGLEKRETTRRERD